MLSYCLKCRKNTESKNPKVVGTKNGRIMLLSKCTVCNSKKSKSNSFVRSAFVLKYKMDKIINKFLLAEDKFMPEMHLRQLGFTYNACGPFSKNKKRIKKFEETGDSRYIYQNELDKACFKHDMAHGDLNRRIAADKVLRDKAFILKIRICWISRWTCFNGP